MIENNKKILKLLEDYSNITKISHIIYSRVYNRMNRVFSTENVYVFVDDVYCAVIQCNDISLLNIKHGDYTYKEFKKLLEKSIKDNETN